MQAPKVTTARPVVTVPPAGTDDDGAKPPSAKFDAPLVNSVAGALPLLWMNTVAGAGHAAVALSRASAVIGWLAASTSARLAPTMVLASCTVGGGPPTSVAMVSVPVTVAPPRSVPITAAGGVTTTLTDPPTGRVAGTGASVEKPPVKVSPVITTGVVATLVTTSVAGVVAPPHSACMVSVVTSRPMAAGAASTPVLASTAGASAGGASTIGASSLPQPTVADHSMAVRIGVRLMVAHGTTRRRRAYAGTMLASLVIPTRNRARTLERTLAALTGQRGPAFEVVVVDDGSEDATPDVARRYRDRLDLRYLRRAPRGIAAARAAAMRAARGEVLIQTDDDRVPAPTFVADHVAAHADGAWVVAGQQAALLAAWSRAAELPAAAVAEVVARAPEVAARLIEPEAELVAPEQLADDLAGAVARFGVAERWWQDHGVPLRARYGATLDGYHFGWALAIGGNTSVPAALAADVGYLDEQFVGWGLEDTDFHLRLARAGARVKIIDGGLSYHQLHRRGPELGRQWLANARRLIHKHDDLALSTYLVTVVRQGALPEASALVDELVAASPAVQAEVHRCHRALLDGVSA